MLEDINYKIVQMHIGSFERKDGILSFDIKKYPERLCIHDKKNKIVVDVETGHQYPYVRILNMQEVYYKEDTKLLTSNKRVGCIEYSTILCELDKEKLELCKNIISLLQKGHLFLDGNKILTNEQYLEIINNSENIKKTKKIGRKRK